MIASTGGMALGFVLGVRHAFEPDHLTAVTALVTESRRARSSMWLGAIWGVGHTFSVVALGTALLVFGAALPARATALFELAVAVMLIALGTRSLHTALREGRCGPVHRHCHGNDEHVHPGPYTHVHVGGRTLAWRPLIVGVVHGLAGSGAITALVFAELPTFERRVLYLVLFGIGSIAGMTLATGVVGASFRRVASTRSRYRVCAIATGVMSIGLGMLWALPDVFA